MKQLFQHLDTGETALIDVPAPQVSPGSVLIRSVASVVSAGTERMLVDFGRANPLQKARQQPARVKQVLDKARTDGVAATVSAVRNQLAQPLPLGYCNAGVVAAIGTDVDGIKVGDRVVSNGAHTELAIVPVNLVARIPDDRVTFEQAAFTPLAAIGLHGVRLAAPTLGERFVVVGLGLVGLLALQVLRAHGCEVLGIDVDPARVALARTLGCEAVDVAAGQDPIDAARAFSAGRGADGVLITAATMSDEPMRQAVQMCRKKGRIVLVGVAGLNLSRDLFYEKELSFQVSCSYGPGRYDPDYEQGGIDYPLPYVRWTEGRNFEAALGLMARGALQVTPLITHRFAFTEAPRAYELLHDGTPSLGIVLNYPAHDEHDADGPPPTTVAAHPTALGRRADGASGVGVIGAGNYANQTLLPALADLGVSGTVIASRRGASAGLAARRFGFERASSDPQAVLEDPQVGSVFVLTRHDAHAGLAVAALGAGKAVFVEKPLAITAAELQAVRAAWAAAGPSACLTVGFNRRYSPHVQQAKRLLDMVGPQPKAMVMTVNAGALPPGHWLNDAAVGGGRLVGEGCHFVDLLRHLAGSPIDDVQVLGLAADGDEPPESFSVTLRFVDGSIGTLHYFSNGHRRYPKERLDVFVAGRTLTLDNFTRLRGRGWPGFRGLRTRRQDKGHRQLVEAFLAAAAGETPLPIPVEELFEVSAAVLNAAAMLRR